MAGPHDCHPASLQGLAQRVKRGSRELRELVEEEHAVVRQHRLPNPSTSCATDQFSGCDRMMGRPKRTLARQLATASQLSSDALNAHHFDRLGALQWRQDRRQALSEHRLARPRWPAQQTVVGASRGDHKSLYSLGLTTNIAQIESLLCR